MDRTTTDEVRAALVGIVLGNLVPVDFRVASNGGVSMILAIDTHGVLFLFDAEEQVLKALETVDIENHEYEFCDDTGQKFVAEITKPVTRFRGGAFKLVPVGHPDRSLPLAFANKARELGNTYPGVSDLDDLKKLLRAT
jgi:hypothetical protein